MAYFQTKRGSLEESIRKAVINEASVRTDLDDDPKLFKQIERMGVKVKKHGKPQDGYQEVTLSGPQAKIDAANKKLNLLPENKNLDKVNPAAVKKKFKDRKDKDIDNDGDVDSSDEFLHKRRKAISKAMGEEITEEEFEMMIETLTELSQMLLKIKKMPYKSQRADDRLARCDHGKGDSELAKKLDRDERSLQKQGNLIRVLKKEEMPEWTTADKLDKGPKSKNPDVDDQGLTRSQADVVRQGNIVSKDAEKVRRKYAAGKQKPVDARQGGRKQGSIGATDRTLEKRKTHMISTFKRRGPRVKHLFRKTIT